MHNTNELLTVLDRVAGAGVLVVGDVMLDRYWSGKASRLSPEAPVPVVALDRVSDIPGGAANVAANIAGLGAKAVLAGVTGEDECGSALRSALKARGIEDGALLACTSRRTTTKTRVLVHNQQIARIDDETSKPLSETDESRFCDSLAAAVDGVGAIVISDYAKGCLTESVLAELFALASASGKPVIVDPKARQLSRYNGATVLTPNLSEALNAAGMGDKNEEHVAEAAAAILASVEVESLLITLGEHGMKLFERGRQEQHFPSFARQVFDVTGAGDTVVAVLAAATASGAPLTSAISLANIAAGLAVEKVGTSIVGVDELRHTINEMTLHMSADR
jgi:D-beta-D-heptose 7-phosphate kinase / D-beta-D-heptose 1-phosphate adenosyltransferase